MANKPQAAPQKSAPSGAAVTATAPAPQAAAPVRANGTVTQHAVLPTPTELQQDAETAFGDMAQLLAGITTSDEPEETPAASPQKKQKPTPTQGETATQATTDEGQDEEEGDEATPTGDGPVLAEDDDSETDPDADAEEEAGDLKHDKATQEQLFKLRQSRRELKEQLAAKDAELKKVQEKVAALTQGDTAKAVAFDGFFSNVKTADDLASSESWLEQRLAFLEDNEDGFTEPDGNGGEVDRDARWIKQQRRAVLAELKRVPQIRQTLETVATRQKESTDRAQKLYPFVFNPTSKFHDGVLELAKETPELNALPNKSLLLGRLRIAQLVESGEYTLVPKVKPKAKAAGDPEPEPAISARVKRPPASPAASARNREQVSTANPQPKQVVVDSRSADALGWALELAGAGN